MTRIISTLPPIHTPSFMKVAQIVFELLQDPDFIGQTERRTDGQTDGAQTYSPPPVFHTGRGLITTFYQYKIRASLERRE